MHTKLTELMKIKEPKNVDIYEFYRKNNWRSINMVYSIYLCVLLVDLLLSSYMV